MKINWENMGKATREALRVMVLAIIPIAIVSLEAWKVDWRLIIIVSGVSLLRFIDKLLHEMGKEKGQEKLLTGLTRF